MTLQTEITRADWDAFVRFVNRRPGKTPAQRLGRWLTAVVIGVLAGLAGSVLELPLHLPSFGAGVVAMLLWVAVSTRTQMRKLGPAPDGFILGPRTLTVGDAGLREVSSRHDSLFPWHAIRDFHDAGPHFFIMVDRNAAVLVPHRAFPDAPERDAFSREMRARFQPGGAIAR